MIWIIGTGCFLGGSAIGALLFKILMSDEVRIRALEDQLQALSEEHEKYKSSVHSHFNSSAQLLNKLTDSYRDVYMHQADGARSLCPDYISNQLSLSGNNRALLEKDASAAGHFGSLTALGQPLTPPLDYAQKTDPGQKGQLADDYGLGDIQDKT
jgi:uncharacterized membrane-anchored protein YhcB (DUF1043 family)